MTGKFFFSCQIYSNLPFQKESLTFCSKFAVFFFDWICSYPVLAQSDGFFSGDKWILLITNRIKKVHINQSSFQSKLLQVTSSFKATLKINSNRCLISIFLYLGVNVKKSNVLRSFEKGNIYAWGFINYIEDILLLSKETILMYIKVLIWTTRLFIVNIRQLFISVLYHMKKEV